MAAVTMRAQTINRTVVTINKSMSGRKSALLLQARTAMFTLRFWNCKTQDKSCGTAFNLPNLRLRL